MLINCLGIPPERRLLELFLSLWACFQDFPTFIVRNKSSGLSTYTHPMGCRSCRRRSGTSRDFRWTPSWWSCQSFPFRCPFPIRFQDLCCWPPPEPSASADRGSAQEYWLSGAPAVPIRSDCALSRWRWAWRPWPGRHLPLPHCRTCWCSECRWWRAGGTMRWNWSWSAAALYSGNVCWRCRRTHWFWMVLCG